jgi:hypothetical protein
MRERGGGTGCSTNAVAIGLIHSSTVVGCTVAASEGRLQWQQVSHCWKHEEGVTGLRVRFNKRGGLVWQRVWSVELNLLEIA